MSRPVSRASGRSTNREKPFNAANPFVVKAQSRHDLLLTEDLLRILDAFDAVDEHRTGTLTIDECEELCELTNIKFDRRAFIRMATDNDEYDRISKPLVFRVLFPSYSRYQIDHELGHTDMKLSQTVNFGDSGRVEVPEEVKTFFRACGGDEKGYLTFSDIRTKLTSAPVRDLEQQIVMCTDEYLRRRAEDDDLFTNYRFRDIVAAAKLPSTISDLITRPPLCIHNVMVRWEIIQPQVQPHITLQQMGRLAALVTLLKRHGPKASLKVDWPEDLGDSPQPFDAILDFTRAVDGTWRSPVDPHQIRLSLEETARLVDSDRLKSSATFFNVSLLKKKRYPPLGYEFKPRQGKLKLPRPFLGMKRSAKESSVASSRLSSIMEGSGGRGARRMVPPSVEKQDAADIDRSEVPDEERAEAQRILDFVARPQGDPRDTKALILDPRGERHPQFRTSRGPSLRRVSLGGDMKETYDSVRDSANTETNFYFEQMVDDDASAASSHPSLYERFDYKADSAEARRLASHRVLAMEQLASDLTFGAELQIHRKVDYFKVLDSRDDGTVVSPRRKVNLDAERPPGTSTDSAGTNSSRPSSSSPRNSDRAPSNPEADAAANNTAKAAEEPNTPDGPVTPVDDGLGGVPSYMRPLSARSRNSSNETPSKSVLLKKRDFYAMENIPQLRITPNPPSSANKARVEGSDPRGPPPKEPNMRTAGRGPAATRPQSARNPYRRLTRVGHMRDVCPTVKPQHDAARSGAPPTMTVTGALAPKRPNSARAPPRDDGPKWRIHTPTTTS